MNKLHHSLFILIFSSVLTNMANQESAITPARKQYVTTKKLKRAWQNNVVKVGTVTAACALLYALGVKCNIIAAPALLCAANNVLQSTQSAELPAAAPQSNDDNATQLSSADVVEQKKSNTTDEVTSLQQKKQPTIAQSNTLQPDTTQPEVIQANSSNTQTVVNTNNSDNQTTVPQQISNSIKSEQLIKDTLSAMFTVLANAKQEDFNS